jgi:glucose/arabinose dehydrogenase
MKRSISLGGAFLLLIAGTAHAAGLPLNFTEALVATGISSPTAMSFAPDGRLFVCQQGGQLRVIKNGSLLATPFLTVSVDSGGERGLLGVAFDPNFAVNHYVYIYYTVLSTPRHNRISRFTANGDVAVLGSETIILELNDLSTATNHNGGAIHFGPDGKLYAAAGDNANGSNSQTLTNLLGKILRLNADGTVPSNNPFFNQTSGNNRMIWALGLRNPFTFAFQSGTTRMFINDVGENTWEEINDGIAGSNYGWPATEGPTTNPLYRSPVFYYSHGSGPTVGCAITGGAFYNPATQNFPASYTGKYFFADYCSGWIRVLETGGYTASDFASGISSPVDLQVGPEGYLYYLARGNGGQVYKVWYTANQPPQITTQPANQTVAVGQTATFSVGASGSSPLSYQWYRNGGAITGATSSSYTTPQNTLADNGAQFHCVVTNPFGTAASSPATLTVTSNTPPTATIITPAVGTMYSGGQTILYSGSGTDTQDGALSGNAFTWQVDFHHDTHTHPFIPPTTGATGGSFQIPNTGETSANVFYRILLTVRDSGGLTNSTFRDIFPRTAIITLASNPTGLQLTLDGQPVTAPFAVTGVVGILRSIGAVTPQRLGKIKYTFQTWSDGGAATHTIATPATNTTYTATFKQGGGPPR